MLKVSEIKQYLLEELENKKHFDANWDIDCDCCGDPIQEGDDFVFIGNKRKVCGVCLADMVDYLDE